MHCPSLSEHAVIVQGTRVTHTGMAGTLYTWCKSLNKRWASCRPWEPTSTLAEPPLTVAAPSLDYHNKSATRGKTSYTVCIIPAACHRSHTETAGGNPRSHSFRCRGRDNESQVAESKDQVLREDPNPPTHPRDTEF